MSVSFERGNDELILCYLPVMGVSDLAKRLKYGLLYRTAQLLEFILKVKKLPSRLNIIFSIIPVISMPEFTITKHSYFLSDKNNVRVPENFRTVLSVAKSA